MVRDYEERGVSTFHHDRGQMAHVFQQIILPHIVDRPTRVYFENLDWNEAEPEELGRAFSQLVKISKSHKNKIFQIDSAAPTSLLFPRNCRLPTNYIIRSRSWRRMRS